jgi:hypothetical protein
MPADSPEFETVQMYQLIVPKAPLNWVGLFTFLVSSKPSRMDLTKPFSSRLSAAGHNIIFGPGPHKALFSYITPGEGWIIICAEGASEFTKKSFK